MLRQLVARVSTVPTNTKHGLLHDHTFSKVKLWLGSSMEKLHMNRHRLSTAGAVPTLCTAEVSHIMTRQCHATITLATSVSNNSINGLNSRSFSRYPKLQSYHILQILSCKCGLL